MKKISQITNGISLGAMTAAERAAGRYMRAPDHPGGDGGSGDGASGGEGGSAGSGGGDAGAAGAGGAGGEAQGAGAGEGGAAGGDGQSSGDSTILGDAAAGGEGGGDAGAGGEAANEGEGGDGGKAGEGKEGESGGEEGPRLKAGEGDDAFDILGAPEAYDLALPADLAEKGMTFDKDAFEAVEPILRDLNLSNDAAQRLTNAYAEKIIPLMQQRAAEQGDAVGAEMRREWAAAAETEFNGQEGRPTLQEAKALSRQAFLKFGVKADSPFLQLLEDSGLGSHPDMIRFVSGVGKAVGEAAIAPGGGGNEPQRLADRVYGKPIPREG